MNTWRPFASDLVIHTFDDFRKKYDKLYSLSPQKTIQVKEKFDFNNVFPFNLSTNDLEKRLENFKILQKKVGDQRDQIKKNDELHEKKKKAKYDLHKRENNDQRLKKITQMQRIRSLGMNRSYRDKSKDSQDANDMNVFNLTTINRTVESYNNKPYTSRNQFPPLTSRNKLKLLE